MNLYAVIMAGGSGTRFWPASRQKRPKQLLTLTGERSLLQQTVDRLGPLTPLERVLVVTGSLHADEVLEQLPDLPPRTCWPNPWAATPPPPAAWPPPGWPGAIPRRCAWCCPPTI